MILMEVQKSGYWPRKVELGRLIRACKNNEVKLQKKKVVKEEGIVSSNLADSALQLGPQVGTASYILEHTLRKRHGRLGPSDS